MASNDFDRLLFFSRTKLAVTIETMKNDLHGNEKEIEDILKDPSAYNDSLLAQKITTCADLSNRLDTLQEKLIELELKDSYKESSNVLKDFIQNISNVKTDCGPEALIVVPSDEVGNRYFQLMRRLNQDNTVIVTVKAILEDAVSVTLRNVKVALLDGPGLAPVRLVVEDRVPAEMVFYIKNDGHRDACFKQVFQIESGESNTTASSVYS